MPVTRCSIIRVDWLHKYAFVVATFEDPNITGIKLSLRKYPEIIEALQSKKPVIVKDIITDPIMQSVRDIIKPLGIKSILVLPIIFREKVIGTLFLRTSRKVHTFSANEVRLLNAIASASANALYNAFLFEQVEDERVALLDDVVDLRHDQGAEYDGALAVGLCRLVDALHRFTGLILRIDKGQGDAREFYPFELG